MSKTWAPHIDFNLTVNDQELLIRRLERDCTLVDLTLGDHECFAWYSPNNRCYNFYFETREAGHPRYYTIATKLLYGGRRGIQVDYAREVTLPLTPSIIKSCRAYPLKYRRQDISGTTIGSMWHSSKSPIHHPRLDVMLTLHLHRRGHRWLGASGTALKPVRVPWNGLYKVISGGQLGVDEAALRVASSLGYETGGWAPREFRSRKCLTEFGVQFLEQEPLRTALVRRAKACVDGSDATLALELHNSIGTRSTINYCKGRWGLAQPPDTVEPVRPVFVVDRVLFAADGTPAAVQRWIAENSVSVLNVCGNRDEDTTEVYAFLRKVLDPDALKALRDATCAET